jgi:hypothetical protein
MSDPARDPLDQAIDRVAARLVSVEHDEAMVERIVARLPERNGVGGWLRVLAPQAALAAVLIVAGLVWMRSDREQVVRDPAVAPSAVQAGGSTVPAPSAIVSAPVNATRMAARRMTPAAPALPADHERSLTPVEAPIPLEVVSLASPSLPEEAFVVLAPIVLTELPLSGESNSPR